MYFVIKLFYPINYDLSTVQDIMALILEKKAERFSANPS